MTPKFTAFPKMARLSRDVLITEKIDGTNAQIFIEEQGADIVDPNSKVIACFEEMSIRAGSRTKWITPSDDNFGFARWVQDNAEQLVKLGPGRHFGEWWGQGIQRKYGLDHKRFSLFNTIRWCESGQEPKRIPAADPRIEKFQERAPECCHVVPVLYQGPFSTHVVDAILVKLMEHGSQAAPGFMNPEGLVLYHIAGNVGFKKTIHGDESPKSLA